MQKMLKIVAVSSLTVALAACHTTKPANQNPNAAENGATSYGLGQKGGLNGADVNGGGTNAVRHVNSSYAPSNQVYYFAYDQSGLSSEDLRAITAQVNYVQAHPSAKVRLEGNADDRGSREYNVALGWRRAKAVARVFEARGIPKSQYEVVSYGKEHPAVVGENEHAWSLNRRVELIYVQK